MSPTRHLFVFRLIYHLRNNKLNKLLKRSVEQEFKNVCFNVFGQLKQLYCQQPTVQEEDIVEEPSELPTPAPDQRFGEPVLQTSANALWEEHLRELQGLQADGRTNRASIRDLYESVLTIMGSGMVDLYSADERAAILYNIRYVNRVIFKQAIRARQQHVRTILSPYGPFQTQGFSNYCGLCCINNILGQTEDGNFPITVSNMDHTADMMWLQMLNNPENGIVLRVEPLRDMEGFYSWEVMHEMLQRRGLTVYRINSVSLMDITSSEVVELLLSQVNSDSCDLIIRLKSSEHWLSVRLLRTHAVLFDSKKLQPIITTTHSITPFITFNAETPGAVYAIGYPQNSEQPTQQMEQDGGDYNREHDEQDSPSIDDGRYDSFQTLHIEQKLECESERKPEPGNNGETISEYASQPEIVTEAESPLAQETEPQFLKSPELILQPEAEQENEEVPEPPLQGISDLEPQPQPETDPHPISQSESEIVTEPDPQRHLFTNTEPFPIPNVVPQSISEIVTPTESCEQNMKGYDLRTNPKQKRRTSYIYDIPMRKRRNEYEAEMKNFDRNQDDAALLEYIEHATAAFDLLIPDEEETKPEGIKMSDGFCNEKYGSTLEKLKQVFLCDDSDCDIFLHRRHHEFEKNPLKEYNRERLTHCYGSDLFEREKSYQNLNERLLRDLSYRRYEPSKPYSSWSNQIRGITDKKLQRIFEQYSHLPHTYIYSVALKIVIMVMVSEINNCSYEDADRMCIITEMNVTEKLKKQKRHY